MRSLVGPLRQLTVHRLPPANGGLGQKCRRPLYLQLRSMVPQIRTSAFGLTWRFLRIWLRPTACEGNRLGSLPSFGNRNSLFRCSRAAITAAPAAIERKIPWAGFANVAIAIVNGARRARFGKQFVRRAGHSYKCG